MRFDESDISRGEIFLKDQGFRWRTAGDLAQTLSQLARRNVESGGDRVHIGFDVLHPVTHDKSGKRRIVIDDLAAFAIEDLPARSKHIDVTYAVAFCLR